MLRLGASPRASRELYRCAKALAAISGRDFITPDDVHELIMPVLGHRLVPSSEARISGKTQEDVLRGIVERIPAPPEKARLFD
jgi:MoxR-like ATPase